MTQEIIEPETQTGAPSVDTTEDITEVIVEQQKEKTLLDILFENKDKPSYDIPRLITPLIKKIEEESKLLKKYQIIYIHSTSSITDRFLSDIATSLNRSINKSILLVISNDGGEIGSAYLISKLCREVAAQHGKEFAVTIPRRAKSAATLLALGASAIHMGSTSELGPIDPQVRLKKSNYVMGNVPVLGAENGVEYLAELSVKYPRASEMLGVYLDRQLSVAELGSFRRSAESATEYAKRLLHGRAFSSGWTDEKISYHLVHDYQDHSFVIDKDEAAEFLGDMIKVDTQEYVLGLRLFNFLEELQLYISLIRNANYAVEIIGNIEALRITEDE